MTGTFHISKCDYVIETIKNIIKKEIKIPYFCV